MSELTKKALFSILSSDTALTALIGKDENGSAAIFNATFNEVTAESKNWSYPVITFREDTTTADARFTAQTVDAEIFDIEIWAKTTSSLTIPTIHKELDRILHNKTLSLISTQGRNYDCVRIASSPDQYDSKLKLHFGLYRYKFVVLRS